MEAAWYSCGGFQFVGISEDFLFMESQLNIEHYPENNVDGVLTIDNASHVAND